jgi:hypothetical protein
MIDAAFCRTSWSISRVCDVIADGNTYQDKGDNCRYLDPGMPYEAEPDICHYQKYTHCEPLTCQEQLPCHFILNEEDRCPPLYTLCI